MYTLPTSQHMTLMGYQVPQVQEIFKKKLFPDKPPDTILDGTAHIGGDAINFVNMFPNCLVIAIDKDYDAIRCLECNIEKYSTPENFDVIYDDSVDYIRKNLPVVDMMYFDPPWGTTYRDKKYVRLSLGETSITDIVNFSLDNRLTKRVVVKVPRNFDYADFREKTNGKRIEIYYVRKPARNDTIAYALISVTN